jgi:protein-L-isoaspartate(D-aspartate) O-methyltransferase
MFRIDREPALVSHSTGRYNARVMALCSGTKLGPYEIQALLGAGGMGEVYRARDTRLERIVAIKVLPDHLSCNPDSKQRFEREARAISSLNHLRALVYLCSSLLVAGFLFAQGDENLRKRREDMVQTQIAAPRGSGAERVQNSSVLDSMRKTPRDRFVPAELVPYAYDDRPVPIGYGQTISQPYIVAKMTELLEPKREHQVLEIGSGSGYQAAVLSPLVAQVYTIEIIEPLGTAARQRLAALGYKNIEVRVGDGYFGWPERAPFDGIIVTAAANHIPPALIEQLKPGGRMVIPVGNPFQTQMLMLVTKGSKGPRDLQVQNLMPVAFVPLVGGPRSN